MRQPDTQERDPQDLVEKEPLPASPPSVKPTASNKTKVRGNRFKDLTPADLSEREKRSVTKLALAVQKSRFKRGRKLSSPSEITAFLRLKYGDRHNELFGMIFLDNGNRVLAVDEMFNGTINGASVHPRVVVQRALELKVCAAAVAFHDHPSGVCDPSAADEVITRRLKSALALVEVRLLDHIIVTSIDSVSFAERGII